MSFDTDRLTLTEQFIIIEIDLPEITGTCTLPDGSGTGFGTPLTCQESWNETDFKTYFFATENRPIEYGRPRSSAGLPGDVIEISDPVHPVILKVVEEGTILQPGRGLAIRGSLKVNFQDKLGDPGPQGTPTDTGTFFGKFLARNVFFNKAIRIKYFYVQPDGIYAESDAEVRTYSGEVLLNNGNGTYSLTAIDELTKLDQSRAQFPTPTGGSLRAGIDNLVAVIPVDATTDWEQVPRPYTVRIGDELMKVASVTNNQLSTATLNVGTRGADIIFTNTISTTIADSHTSGDDVQICHTSDDERIDAFLSTVMQSAGFIGGDWGTSQGTQTIEIGDTVEIETGASFGVVGTVYKSLTVSGSTNLTTEDYTNATNWDFLGVAIFHITDWQAEVDEWLTNARLDTLWHDSKASNKAIIRILTDFLIDMWYDPVDAEIKISAISVWKATDVALKQGKEINRETLKLLPLDDMRATRSFIFRDKPNKVDNDDIKNFRAVSTFTDLTLEAAGLWEIPKTRQYPPSHAVDKAFGDLLTQRTVARFGRTPIKYTWRTEEKFLNFEVGQIGAIDSQEKQGFDGTPQETRAQIISIKPAWTKFGRQYTVRALTYENAAADGTAFTISGDELNLFVLAGAPSGDVTLTFLLQAPDTGSSDTTIPAIKAGAFTSGSKINLVLQGGVDWQATGGKGATGGPSIGLDIPPDIVSNGPSPGPGLPGGIVYDAQGIDTDIYISKTFDSNAADGTLRAPGGGGGGEDGQGVTPGSVIGGDGGGGGGGIDFGAGGAGGAGTSDPTYSGTVVSGAPGSSGTTSGTGGASGGAGAGAGGGFGEAGATGTGTTGGAAGKGIVDGGATVNLFVDTYFLSSVGVSSIVPGDSVEVAGGHSAGGVVGDVYESKITDAARDLANEDYTVGANWGRQFANGGGDAPNSISA